MACTQQSALEYVRNGRILLVGRLQNLHVIVEHLYQSKVLNENEVSVIEAESERFNQTRKILDMVTVKGEAACYELLKILEATRNRTFPKPPSPFSQDRQDLHYWISCFLFQNDPYYYTAGSKSCHEFQTHLKSRAKKICDNEWIQNKAIFKDKSKWKTFLYIPLVLDASGNKNEISKFKTKKKYKKLRPKKLKTYIPTDTDNVSPDDLLKCHHKKILLVGKPGIGKTTLAQRILSLWAEKDDSDLSYMFYFDERTMLKFSKSVSLSLKSLLFEEYLKPRKGIDEVFQDIEEHSENVVIILDGLREKIDITLLKRIVNKDVLSEAKIIITCRPEDEAEFLSDWPSYRVEVKGFSQKSINTFFKEMFSTEDDTACTVLNNLELFSLCHVPMYAFVVAACLSFNDCNNIYQCSTVTEMCLQIFRLCLKKQGDINLKYLDKYIRDKRIDVLTLAEMSFHAMLKKTVILTGLDCDGSSVPSAFLRSDSVKDSPSSVQTFCAFLHNKMQEFCAALWLLEKPDQISEVLEQCKTEGKHLKYMILLLCGLLSKNSVKLLKCIISEDQIEKISDQFLVEVINPFLQKQTGHSLEEDTVPEFEDEDLLFVCQCVYESQSTQVCLYLLKEIDYRLDLSGGELDPHQCCAVAYVINQSGDRKIQLDLEDCTVSVPGLKLIIGCMSNVLQSCLILCQLWRTALHCGQQSDITSLLRLCGNELHLPVQEKGDRAVFERAGAAMMDSNEKIKLCLHLDQEHPSEALVKIIFKYLQNILIIRLVPQDDQRRPSEEWEKTVNSFQLDLCLQAVLYDAETGQRTVKTLLSLLSLDTPLRECEFLLDLYSHVKETQTGHTVLSELRPFYNSTPPVWTIDLSKKKTSILLDLLKLQTVKKPVELMGWSEEDSELRSFLLCLPYISQLIFSSGLISLEGIKFLTNLFIKASEIEAQTGKKTLQLLSSVCCYFSFPFVDYYTFPFADVYYCEEQSEFLLDLYSHLKDYETQTGQSLLPALQPVYDAVSVVWTIDLSERKASILFEVLKLQTEKKPVELRGWSDKESELKSFLLFLPYISQLRFFWLQSTLEVSKFLIHLFIKASEIEAQTREKTLQLLSSVCSYSSFPFDDEYDYECEEQSEFLLDLYSDLKDYETQTGQSLLPALQPVYDSVSVVWTIDLTKIKTSIILEVLKLQTVKKPVVLIGWSEEERELRSFLQCLPYISQLRFLSDLMPLEASKFLTNLFIKASEIEAQTGEKTLQLLSSVCSYSSFPFANGHISVKQSEFLLDLYSHVKVYETQIGQSVLPKLWAVYDSAPAFWTIDLTKIKTSIILEVLKLQTVKKPVVLIGWSEEERELRSFLQCLPYISQLRFLSDLMPLEVSKFLTNLFIKASEIEAQTGEKTLQLLSSVCSYSSFPFDDGHISVKQSEFLLDLYSHVKVYETQIGQSVLPKLWAVYDSAPAFWTIDLTKIKTSIILEVLKLQTVKKPVVLIGWSEEERELRSFLQCLPYISQLGFFWFQSTLEVSKYLIHLFIKASEIEAQTGEKTLQLLSSVCSYSSFPFADGNRNEKQSEFLLDLYSHVKVYETQTGQSVLPSLQRVYQSVSVVWTIDLSERKASILLEVLKLKSVKKSVELRGWSDKESELKSFLQCLPYISQLRFLSDLMPLEASKFLTNLFIKASEIEAQTREKTLQLLSSVCSYSSFPFADGNRNEKQSEFLLDLYSHVKVYETQTGQSVLPSLQRVYQSVSVVWTIDLSERKASILLEVLKLKSVKKSVELRGWSDKESELKSFLQCLPYISQLRFSSGLMSLEASKFLTNLFIKASEIEAQTREKTLQLLSSVCSYSSFPFDDEYDYECEEQSEFLLDLYSHLKDYETQTGQSLLPALQPVYDSVSVVWTIDLTKIKTSIILEVLKLQTVKKPVVLIGWSEEERELRSFLQCLPYISQLRFLSDLMPLEASKFLTNLFIKASEIEAQTGEKTLQLLSSVCSYSSFPFANGHISVKQSEFLLDLYSHVKVYETQIGQSVLPKLWAVYDSAPAFWTIDLTKIKTSIILEVLKLQTVKKPVVLIGWSEEERELRSFLQCLPYISQLRFLSDLMPLEVSKFLTNLFIKASEIEAQTGEKTLQLLSSVCSYSSFPFANGHISVKQSEFLLDLYSHVKVYETQIGQSVLPKLWAVYDSAPAFWTIDLTKIKTSIILEVLKLQTVKKPVVLIGWSEEERELRSFLQCLPYISQLGFFWFQSTLEVSKYLIHLFIKASEIEAQTGEKTLQLLSSVCSYSSFPFADGNRNEKQSEFLLDLYSHVKVYETQTGQSVLPSLQRVYQSVSVVWTIDLSERKASILLEVLKLKSVKKSVELRGWSDKESELKSFLQCLPYISQLRFLSDLMPLEASKFLTNLFIKASEIEAQTREKTLQLLSSVCSYSSFPFDDEYDYECEEQSEFLLDLYSHVKVYETQTGQSLLPALQPVYDSAPPFWTIDLSERKTSILLDLLKLQTVKKPVKLIGWSEEGSELRSFLHCLPFISQLSCDDQLFTSVCKTLSVDSRDDARLLASLLQTMDFTITVGGVLTNRTCRSVGRVLGLWASRLKLTLTPQSISLKGSALVFRHVKCLHKLRLHVSMPVMMTRLLRAVRRHSSVTVEELSLALSCTQPPEGVLSRMQSSLASLLRLWKVQCLDLSDCKLEGHSLTILLCLQGPLTVKLCGESLQQLTVVVYEAQEEELTQSFLEKVGGDLTPCTLDWEVIHYLLQTSKQHQVTLDLRKTSIKEQNIRDLLPFVDRIHLKRLSSSFMKSALKLIFERRDSHWVSSLMREADNWINLNTRVLDSGDCDALRFALYHSDGVRLNLMWASISEEEIKNIVPLLYAVSQLRVDRKLLLKFLHRCVASDVQQGAALSLIRALQYKLDFSCSSAEDLSEQEDGESLCLSAGDCRVISTMVQLAHSNTELILRDCDIQDTALEELFPALHKVQLTTSKPLLLQLLGLTPVGGEGGSVRRAASLSRALSGKVDLSQTRLDLQACRSLALLLEHSEGLSELDLSHCQLTDACIELLLPHLYKAPVLDLSDNDIADHGALRIHQVVSSSSSIQTVRLYDNRIGEARGTFLNDQRYEFW